MTTDFVPTVSNMVTSVRNIIEGYVMGPVRALAQEPVQNSKDAATGSAHVEYRLHQRTLSDGTGSYMLTVTDRNTTGLRGLVLSLGDIQARGNVLKRDENWAAFEGMGYTKEDETALGSRGQGKAAFLYHSHLPRAASGQDRMMMLYDTLLAGGEYRLGVRYTHPYDSVKAPPFVGDEARRIVSSRYVPGDGLEIPLGLEPLAEVGTRVIVPHLSQEAVAAFHSGELHRWLQRCWWRAVQTGMTIALIDEHGIEQRVAAPSFWEDEPWRRPAPDVRLYENVPVAGGLQIKRIVLSYDASLDEPDIEDLPNQFWGVQLLRGQQWIETLASSSALADYIPRDKRPGFRGFVEFDRGTEPELRRAESSQHDRFDRRTSGVKALVSAIEAKVREFAEERGWSAQESTRPAPGRERDAAFEFLRFLNPRARGGTDGGKRKPAGPSQLGMNLGPAERWECGLRLEYPNDKSARVDWGQHIRNVEVTVELEPPALSKHATAFLELAHVEDTAPIAVAELPIEIRNGHGAARFGDFQIITGAPGAGKLQCARPGKWRLIARIESGGGRVARASRSIFVNEDPPTHDSNPYTLSISVENHTTQQRRIESGDAVGVQVSVTNRTPDAQSFAVNASLGGLLLADEKPINVPGAPLGATPDRTPAVQANIIVNPSSPPPALSQSVNLPPGRHALRADLYLDGEPVAHASRILDIEVDPAQPQDWPPFRIEQIDDAGPHPRWQFDKQDPDDWVLQYPRAYPLYRALDAGPNRSGPQLSGASAFVVDACAEGIIEWAMDPLDGGDASRLDELLDGAPGGVDPGRWDEYRDKMQALAGRRRHPEQVDDYAQLTRECAARSLNLFEERA